jgi:hypothetical protein
LVGRHRRLANQHKILHFRGAALLHTLTAWSSICTCLKGME